MPGSTERIELLPEVQVPDAGRLGRHLHHDPRSRAFPLRAMLAEAKKPGHQTWFRRGVYDQGATSSCVGQSVAGLVLSSPNLQKLEKVQRTSVNPLMLYRSAQLLDPWPGGEPNYFGTSTLAGMKAAKAQGLIAGYRWGFSLEDVLLTLTQLGPVVIGVNWYEGMDHPKADGRIVPSGQPRGGHAVELTGINSDEKTVRGVNSWGPGWGDRGRFELSWDDLGRLLDEDGEAAWVEVPAE